MYALMDVNRHTGHGSVEAWQVRTPVWDAARVAQHDSTG